MSWINLLTKNAYSETVTNSTIEFENDFLNFPPKPLVCEIKETEIKIIKVNDIGDLFYNAIMFYNLIKAEKPGTNIYLKGNKDLEGLINSYKEFKITAFSTRKDFDNLNLLSKVIMITILVLLIILTAPITITALIYFSIRLLYNYKKKRKNTLGYFMPMFKEHNHLIIKKHQENRIIARELSTISHEHIHLLQHLNNDPSFIYKEVVNLDLLLDKDNIDKKSLVYLLDKEEVEARLHEFVLSYYRHFKELPLNIEGLLNLLHSCKELDKFIEECFILNELSGPFTIESSEEYNIRNNAIAIDIKHILLFMKNDEIALKYILEVLPVMYSNLLSYYGDEESSKAFKRQIYRPNLYDRLYSSTV